MNFVYLTGSISAAIGPIFELPQLQFDNLSHRKFLADSIFFGESFLEGSILYLRYDW